MERGQSGPKHGSLTAEDLADKLKRKAGTSFNSFLAGMVHRQILITEPGRRGYRYNFGWDYLNSL